MILEADEKSTRPQAPKNTVLPVDPVFDRASYADQYGIALDRLRLEGDMNAVCLATTNRHDDNPVRYPNPHHDLQPFRPIPPPPPRRGRRRFVRARFHGCAF